MKEGLLKIRNAFISVYDKMDLIPFASFLKERDVSIMSSGGTAKALHDAGIVAREVSDYTGFPECFGGRVKTLHPKVHGGLLFRRDNDGDVAFAEEKGIISIDLLVCNLYPFREKVKQNSPHAEIIENIDIGGPAMIRSAAKNHESVLVITDHCMYPHVIREIEESGGVSYEMRLDCASDAYASTYMYDREINKYLDSYYNSVLRSKRESAK